MTAAGRRRALAIDVGTGTQDVLLFDADQEIENAVRLILPSPTVILAERIRAATRARRPVLLTGGLMGGGPVAWAARDHAAAELAIAATAEAAGTMDDDLEQVHALGIQVVPSDGVAGRAAVPGTVTVDMRDAWLPELARALALFDVDLSTVDAVAIAVFDHGAAPPGVSDRRFRFERLHDRLAAEPDLGPVVFSYLDVDVPAAFTRLATAAAAVRTWLDVAGRPNVPVLAMDTGPAAILGALDDARVGHELERGRRIVAVNVGNFHTLAMRLEPGPRISGIFEHHTGELTRPQLARFLHQLADGTIRDDDVFGSQGHGALVVPGVAVGTASRETPPFLTLTGPRRELLAGHVVRGLGRPHLAVPHGDMMQAGPFGLLRALAWRVPSWREAVIRRLG
ncbi:MAG TPA: DUF1786 family protein [Candidatus Limnocylindrales bacterium]